MSVCRNGPLNRAPSGDVGSTPTLSAETRIRGCGTSVTPPFEGGGPFGRCVPGGSPSHSGGRARKHAGGRVANQRTRRAATSLRWGQHPPRPRAGVVQRQNPCLVHRRCGCKSRRWPCGVRQRAVWLAVNQLMPVRIRPPQPDVLSRGSRAGDVTGSREDTIRRPREAMDSRRVF